MGKQRTVRLDKFRKQIAENVIGEDNLVRIEFGGGPEDYVTIKLPIMLPEDDDFMDRIAAASNSDDRDLDFSLVVLSGHPTRTAEEQVDIWLEAGNTYSELANVYAVEARAAQERLGNFRYRP